MAGLGQIERLFGGSRLAAIPRDLQIGIARAGDAAGFGGRGVAALEFRIVHGGLLADPDGRRRSANPPTSGPFRAAGRGVRV
ncbi:hypothetical protein, partial [Phenylobacterium sp.]|uniref:hypothetical protein n=1 Tax=Phenylobacterium sp. TaxID=1871053 RepID=UPI00286A2B7B